MSLGGKGIIEILLTYSEFKFITTVFRWDFKLKGTEKKINLFYFRTKNLSGLSPPPKKPEVTQRLFKCMSWTPLKLGSQTA
jgi:hypothetical protein